MTLENVNKSAEESFNEAEKMTAAVEKDIELKKKELFKETQDLFEKREEQAHLIGQISACLSASRNLQANINTLKQQAQRQQELLYNAEF